MDQSQGQKIEKKMRAKVLARSKGAKGGGHLVRNKKAQDCFSLRLS
jgi:hypothetical protein